MTESFADIDGIISHLTSLQDSKYCKLKEPVLAALCERAREVLKQEPMLLELNPPLNVCGDLHGQFEELMRIFANCGTLPDQHYLFLGDYVDRGKRSTETISLLLAYKVRYPKNVHLLRGNHECEHINQLYGFYDEVKRRYSTRLWRNFVACFEYLPAAAVVGRRIFCCHGGLSPELKELQQIRDLKRPTPIPLNGLLCDLVWADINYETLGWGTNSRGISVTYAEDIIRAFLAKHDFDMICRAHEVVEDGYEFFCHRSLVTIFSASNYCGEMNNSGAVLKIDGQLTCSFTILEPTKHIPNCRKTPKVIYCKHGMSGQMR